MAASVLNTTRAAEVSVFVVRAFVKLRRTIAEHKELARQLAQVERRLTKHDQQIMSLIQAIRQLTSPASVPKKRRIGFCKDETQSTVPDESPGGQAHELRGCQQTAPARAGKS